MDAEERRTTFIEELHELETAKNKQIQGQEASLEKLQSDNQYLISLLGESQKVLYELDDLMMDIRDGEYMPDTFTMQPARIIMEKIDKILDSE